VYNVVQVYRYSVTRYSLHIYLKKQIFWKFDHPLTFRGVKRGPKKNLGPIGLAILTFIGNKQTDGLVTFSLEHFRHVLISLVHIRLVLIRLVHIRLCKILPK